MKLLLALIGSVLLLAVAAFCLFGFLASFEPSSTPGTFVAFRIGYVIIGVGCLVGIVALLVKTVRK